MINEVFTRQDLENLERNHDNFVGIDSDGCVFDTMEIKQKKCFHTVMVAHWELQAVEKATRECAEFINLYSTKRGTNRFPALVDSFDLLRERPEPAQTGTPVPRLDSLRKWIASTTKLGNPELELAVQETNDPELTSVLKWSKDVNDMIKDTIKKVPPFPWALKSLQMVNKKSDVICVSQTPTEALVREWHENNIRQYVKIIAGQELGTKTEHIAMATKGHYKPERILMVGDAPGDYRAAKANNALFFPINPGHENDSWQRFFEEGYEKFISESFRGTYQENLLKEFNELLPEKPSWT